MFRACDKCGEDDSRTFHLTVSENNHQLVDLGYLCAACRAEIVVYLSTLPRPRRLR